MKNYLLIALAFMACVSAFAQAKKGPVKPKANSVPCTILPVVSSTVPASRCGKGTISLAATGSEGIINWYAAAAGGKSLGTGASFTTPAIASTTTYYVAAANKGCVSARTAVTATVLPLPAKPVIQASGSTSLCEGQSVQLTTATSAPGLKWSTGETKSSITASRTADYTVTVTDANGCSFASAPVAVNIYPYPFITSITPGQRCGRGQMPLGAKASAGLVRWHATATDTATISYGTLYFTPTYIATRTETFYVDAIDHGCISKRMAVPATVNIPAIASVTPGSRSDAGPVQLKATPKSGVINWYAAETGGTPLGKDSLFTTPSLSTSKNYYAEAALNGCVSERKAVLAEVNSANSTAAEAVSTRSILYVYPNPNSGNFTLLANKEGKYTILDAKGKPIRTVQLNRDNNYTVSNQTLGDGTYFVVGEDKSQSRQKLVVAKYRE